MKSRKLSVAIVGCGKFAEQHVREVKKIDSADLVAVCDREELMAQQLAERYNIPREYKSLDAMYHDVKPDVVHVTTPPQSHLQIAQYALEHGSHVYVEKPFTVNYPEALRLIEVANLHCRKVTVGHIHHFDPAAVEMRRLVSNGVLGQPVHVETGMGYNLNDAYGKGFLKNEKHWIYGLPGGLFQNVISHLVEKVLEFMPDDSPSVRVTSLLRNSEMRQKQRPITDELRVILAGSQVTTYLTLSCSFRPVQPFLRVYGTKNTLEVDFNSRTVVVRRGKPVPTAIGKIFGGFDMAWQYQKSGLRNIIAFIRSDFHYFAGMNYLLRAFYSSILRDSDPPIPYSDILRTAKIMDLIFEQLPDRQELTPAPPNL